MVEAYRVESHGLDLDKNVVVPQLRKRNILDLRLARRSDLDGLHGLGEVGHCE
jgi:hypothetical protein